MYCSTGTSTSTSYTEVWCAPPGTSQGPANNCASATPSLFALLGVSLLMLRRRAYGRLS
jgi:hypothetical protein